MAAKLLDSTSSHSREVNLAREGTTPMAAAGTLTREQELERRIRELEAQMAPTRAAPARIYAVARYVAPGTDTRGDGRFVTQMPKVQVDVMREGQTKPVASLRENVATWAAIVDAVQDIREAMAEADGA